MKSGNLNFLEPSGPPQACNGTALPLSYMEKNKEIYCEIMWPFLFNARLYTAEMAVVSVAMLQQCLPLSCFNKLPKFKSIFKLKYTGCPRRNVPDFGRGFLMLKYTDIKHLCPKLNVYGDKGARKVWSSTYCTWFAWRNTHTLRIVRPCLQPAQARSSLRLHK